MVLEIWINISKTEEGQNMGFIIPNDIKYKNALLRQSTEIQNDKKCVHVVIDRYWRDKYQSAWFTAVLYITFITVVRRYAL